MAGYLIAAIAFVLSFLFGVTGAGRPRVVLVVGALLAGGWLASMEILRSSEIERGYDVLPFWFGAGLVALLYVIWCGGLWLGLRLRRLR